jgi:diguanylate cyclase (GGDEF)-like protein
MMLRYAISGIRGTRYKERSMSRDAPEPPAVFPAAVALVEALVEGTGEAVLLVDGDGRPQVAREGHTKSVLGRTLADVLADPSTAVREADLQRIADAWDALRRQPGRRDTLRFWIRREAGKLVEVHATAVNLLETPLGAIVVRLMALVTEPVMRATEAPDPAPQRLLDRAGFHVRVQRHVERKLEKVWKAPGFARTVSRDRRWDFSVVLLDVDRFKVLAGGFGDEGVAELCERVGRRLADSLRGRDFIGRLSSSELGILLDGVGDVEQAYRTSDQLLGALTERFDLGGQSITIAPIVGIATSERRYQRAEEVIRDAGAAAGRAVRKPAGRRRAAYDTAIRVEDTQRIALTADLRDSLDRDQLYLVFQPVVSLDDRCLTGFEALARWEHPTLGNVPPGVFIPLAEESGIIRTLGQWVLERACERMAAWNAGAAKRPLDVAVNVSAAQLVEADLGSDVETALRGSGLAAERLHLEITESVALADVEATTRVVTSLRNRGIHFALDDFGTGYSSLSYLHRLPYDFVKIDRSFLVENQNQSGMVEAIVRLAHQMKLRVIAEGIETATQRAELERVQCDFAQGYLFGKPLDVRAAQKLIGDDPRF